MHGHIMVGVADGSVYYPQVSFDFDNDPDPELRRKKNMKAARDILKPARHWVFKWQPRWNEHGQCCVTGIQLLSLGPDAYNTRLLDPDTLRPMDDDSRTLFTEFFTDHHTGKAKAFTALWNVDSGAPLRSSYCPELLQLYWLYKEWKRMEDEEHMNERSSLLWRRKKIKMVPKQIDNTDKETPALVDKLEPFFTICAENEGKGVQINQYKNPITGEVDITQINLDLRVMRLAENAQALSGSASSGETS